MEIILCFASYIEKNGMYKDINVDLEDFNKDEIDNEIIEYYKNIGIEEFFLADVWTDDNDAINKLLVKNYNSCYINYFEFLEEIQENLNDLKNIDEHVLDYIIQNNKEENISDIIDIYNNIDIFDDIIEWFHEHFLERNQDINIFSSMLYWMPESQRIDFLCEQGYNINRLKTYLYIIDNN